MWWQTTNSQRICISLRRFFLINNLNKLLLGVDFTARGLSIDDSSVFSTFFFVFLVCKCILVIHCSFHNKNLYQNCLKKNVFAFEKKYFDSLALNPLGLYVNLLGPFVAYSQPFNLVYK
jgi:hypothetical protein